MLNKIKKENVLDVNFLNECFECDFENGLLYYKKRPLHHFKNKQICDSINTRYANKIAGYIVHKSKRSNTEYVGVSISNIREKAHRIIWIMKNGYIQKGMQIDHIDNDGTNNKINNLRLVTQSENHRNKPILKSNITGVNGVNWHKAARKWQVRITDFNGKRIDLGRYDDFDYAVKIRKENEKIYGYLQ